MRLPLLRMRVRYSCAEACLRACCDARGENCSNTAAKLTAILEDGDEADKQLKLC